MSVEAFRQQLEILSRDYRSSLPAKLDEIETLWRELQGGTAAPARLADLRRELHTIVGTAKTLGVAGVSEAAAAAERLAERFAKKQSMPAAARQAEFSRLLDALKRAAQ